MRLRPDAQRAARAVFPSPALPWDGIPRAQERRSTGIVRKWIAVTAARTMHRMERRPEEPLPSMVALLPRYKWKTVPTGCSVHVSMNRWNSKLVKFVASAMTDVVRRRLSNGVKMARVYLATLGLGFSPHT